ncbi:enoyl-CoA hydratase-related protein [Gordonia terrae]
MSLVTVGTADGVTVVTLDSPANRNALSAQLRTELFEAIDTAAGSGARVILLRHNGTVFCAGADLKEARAGAGADAPSVPDIISAIYTSPVPVVAVLSGVARAGGLGIVAACDLAVAAADVTFACTEVRIGVIPAVISAVMRRRMSPQRMHEMFLAAETFDADWAVQAGLIDRVVDPADLEHEVSALIDSFRRAAPSALAGAKKLVRSDESATALRRELDELAVLSQRYFESPDAREGMTAFAEKREPAWRVR